jgi:hypothetical protein
VGEIAVLWVIFVWLKVDGVIHLSWWWMALPVAVVALDSLAAEWLSQRRANASHRAFMRRLGRH